ncbi:MAG TPA: hypothetical protein VMI54_13040 [Polyangiaceae bacterium]|nr:hypothetical protein [Polyangiaceae bacterium]
MSSEAVNSMSQSSYTPSLDDVPVTSDPACALLALMLQSRGAQSNAARENVNRANDELEEAQRQMQEALDRSKQADENSGFWGVLSNVFGGDIATIAEVVASAAAIVATGGVGAAGVLALVAAGMSIGADVGQKAGLDPKVCLALSAGGAIAGVASGQLGAPANVWSDIAKGGRVASAAASTTGAGAQMASDAYHADSMDAQADATSARGAQTEALFRFNLALEVLQQCAHDVQRADHGVATTTKDDSDGKSALLARMRAA